MTPAFRLLAACCRWPDDERRVEAVRAAATGFTDWDGFTALADRHRVEPLASHGLAAAGIEVPAPLAAAVLSARAVTMRDIGETLRIAAALDAAGITHRYLKGIPLGVAAYGTPTLKRSWDIDLLVLPHDAVAVAALLTGMGYRSVVPPRTLDTEEFVRWSVVSKEAEFRAPGGTTIELHWRVSDHPALLATLTARSPARTIEVLGAHSVTTLADAHNLAYLAVHGGAHAWFRLKWIADFNALLGRVDPAALAAAHGDGAGLALDAASALVRHLFHDQPLAPAGRAGTLAALSLAALLADDEAASHALASRARWRLGSGVAFLRTELGFRLRGTLDRIEFPLPPRWQFLYPWLRLPFWVARRLRYW